MCSKYEEKENINAWIVRIFDAPDHGDPALEYNSVGPSSIIRSGAQVSHKGGF